MLFFYFDVIDILSGPAIKDDAIVFIENNHGD